MSGSTPDSTSLGLVRRYLAATGWQIEQRGGKYSFYVYHSPENERLELLIANSEDTRGWKASVRDALETLAGLNDKSMEAVAADVRSIAYDVIRAALPDDLIRDDSIDLDVASAFIWRSKRLLAASATAEIVRTQYFKKTRKAAEQYAGACRFGHTFRGSFGFTLESPLSEVRQQSIIEGMEHVPFERRVVERFARGLWLIEEASKSGDPEILAGNYETGWNANVCDEFLKLRESARGANVHFGLSWSPELRPRPEVGQKSNFKISGREFEIIQDAAELLRERQEEQAEVVSGLVVELRAEHIAGALLAPEGEIVVRWNSEDYGNIKVHMTIPREWYELAIHAHEQALAIVAKGILEKVGRSWRLSGIDKFDVRY